MFLKKIRFSRISFTVFFILGFIFAGEVLGKKEDINWNILEAQTFEEIVPFFNTKNIDQIALGISLLADIAPTKSGPILFDAWKKKPVSIIGIEFLDEPLIRIHLASALSKIYQNSKEKGDFESYIYSQLSNDKSRIKSSAIIGLSSFNSIKAANRLVSISKKEPDYIMEAARSMCNIYLHPEADKNARKIVKERLMEIAEGRFLVNKNYDKNYTEYFKDEIKNVVLTCLGYGRNF